LQHSALGYQNRVVMMMIMDFGSSLSKVNVPTLRPIALDLNPISAYDNSYRLLEDVFLSSKVKAESDKVFKAKFETNISILTSPPGY
jgi:hypothetical protein